MPNFEEYSLDEATDEQLEKFYEKANVIIQTSKFYQNKDKTLIQEEFKAEIKPSRKDKERVSTLSGAQRSMINKK